MPYCAIMIPQETSAASKEDKADGILSLANKLTSGVTTGGLSFSNVTTVMKNTAKLIAENSDEIANKFSGIALTQLLTQGKISNETAFGYLTQGFPQALNQTAIAMGFQSVEQLKTALKSENGVNVQQFIKSFQNFGSALSDFFTGQKTRENTEGYEVIEVDATLSDRRNYSAETPDRRVQSGQTYQEYIHNLPDMLNLECYLQDGRNYSGDEFEDILLNLRERKIAVNVVLGDNIKENVVLTNFTPARGASAGYAYSLEFKKIAVGKVQLVPLNISIASSTVKKVANKLIPESTKTIEEESNGYKKALDETKETGKRWIKGVVEGFKMGWGG
nr:MAG TPA: hypothetical protein [Caudoviricetes sp.]